MNKPNHEKIYLVPDDGVWCWSDTPAPSVEQSNADAVEYVRADLFNQMQAERDALAAQVEALKVHRKELLDLIYNCAIGQVAMSYVVDAESLAQSAYSITGIDAASNRKQDVETPQHHLAEIRAEAVVSFLSQFEGKTYWNKSINDFVSEGYQYADSIRQGEV